MNIYFTVYKILFIQYLFYSLDKIIKLEDRIKKEKRTKKWSLKKQSEYNLTITCVLGITNYHSWYRE